ncbi:hypothetical protein JW826_05480 [Candidatus Woesearchaeota archaeon]|nr:hypothetical protein [Candidatus Woesearchaeota archaeon]
MKTYLVKGFVETAAWRATPAHKYMDEPPGPCQFDIQRSYAVLDQALRSADFETVFKSRDGIGGIYGVGPVAYSSFHKESFHAAHYFNEYSPLAKHAFSIASLLEDEHRIDETLADPRLKWSIEPGYKSELEPARIILPNRHCVKTVSEAILRHLERNLRG